MTQKALGFVVNGMLNNEREVAEKRIAFILSQLDESIIDGFTDGLVNSISVVDESALLEYVRRCNKSKLITSIVKTDVRKDSCLKMRVDVTCNRIVYDKPNGKTWETADKKDEEHTVRTEVQWTDTIYLYPDSNIPGLQFTIL